MNNGPRMFRIAFPGSLLFLLIAVGCQCDRGNGNGNGNGPPNGEEPPVGDQSQVVLGTVLDASSLLPVEGARARLGEDSALTDSDGRFAFMTMDSTKARAVVVTADGLATAERTLAPRGGPRVDLGVMVMFGLDASARVGPEGGELIAPSVGVTVEVPAGAFAEPVDLRLSRLPLGDPLTDDVYLPAPLPEPVGGHASALFGLIIDSGGVQPAVDLQVRVDASYLPDGAVVPVGRFDVSEGRWVDLGLAAAEGGRLLFSTGHLSTFAAALPALPSDDAVSPKLSALERSISPFMPGDPRIDPRSGAVQVGVPVPGLIRRGEEIRLSLYFDSRTVLPSMSVPLVAADAREGETLIGRVVAPAGRASVEMRIEESAMPKAAPAVLVDLDEPRGPGADVAPEGMDEHLPSTLASGSHAAEIQLTRLGEGVLLESASGSFSSPESGEPLAGPAGEVSAPAPIRHRSAEQISVAIDNRGSSPFGPGWHLSGLSRLVQPWCSPRRVTLAGGLDWPALTFGETGDSVLRSLVGVFAEVDVAESDLLAAQVAASGEMIYVGLPARREVWRLDPDGTNPVLVAGGGERTNPQGEGLGTELKIERIAAISAGPRGEGILIATDRYITHLTEDGMATRVAGIAAPCEPMQSNDIRVGESALSSSFCEYIGLDQVLAADPSSDRFIFAVPWVGTFDVVDGVLYQLNTYAAPGGYATLDAAFDRNGRLHYSSDGEACIFIHVDGTSDVELFPSCLAGGPDELVDGPADRATAGGGRAMTFDWDGNLWFLDRSFHAIRRYSPAGEVVTVSGRPLGAPSQRPTAAGGLLSSTVPGDIRSLAVLDPGRVFMGGYNPGDLLTTTPLAGGTLVSMGAGDGSVLMPMEGEGYVRVLENEVVERYDERGLLLSRGKPGEAPLEYFYQSEWLVDLEDERCGIPGDPPRLSKIELAGEELWSFGYDAQGGLERITDAAGRVVRRTSSSSGGDGFELPGGATVATLYDSRGMLIEKSAPGPNGTPDVWSFEWEGRALASFTIPGGHTRVMAAAQDGVKVPETGFDPLQVAREVPARIPVASVPTRSGEATRVVLGTEGVLVQSPSGEETELQSDSFGRLLRVKMPDGASMRLVRDEVGRVVQLSEEATGKGWTYRYARVVTGEEDVPYLRERLVERIDGRHGATRFQHDEQGHLENRIDPNGGMTSFQAVKAGAASGLPSTLEDPEGRYYEISYDSVGNMVGMIVRDRDDPSVRLATNIERDAVGRPTRIVEASGRQVRFEYDPWNAPTKVTVGDASAGHIMVYTRASTAAWAQGGSRIEVSPVLQAVDGEGLIWSYQWAPGWKLVETSEPARGISTDTLDLDGRVVDRSLADGSREEFVFDEAGRLEERIWRGPAQGAWAGFVYDENDRVIELDGALVRESREFQPGFGWSEMSIVPLGGVAPEAGFTMQRGLVFRNRFQSLVGGGRYIVIHGFDDKAERVDFEAEGHWPLPVLTILRDLSRRVVEIERGNGANTSVELDSLARVVRQEETTPSGTTVLTWTWEHDRPSSFSVDGQTRDYVFDEWGRLTGCSDTAEEYTYDRADGRASAGGRAYLRDERGSLIDDGEYEYQYDSLGRRVLRINKEDASDRTVYAYGPGGFLAVISHGPEGAEIEMASYEYDAGGRRISRTTAEGTWRYGYLPDTERVVRVLEPDGTQWHLFHALPAAAWSVAISVDGRRRFTHVDPLDRVIGVSDENGELTLLGEGCFGQRLGSFDLSGPPIGFHGIHYDEETGLYFAGARYYDPGVGAFISPDPLGLMAAPVLYDYAAGNPVMAQDSSGRLLLEAFIGGLLVGGVILNEIRKVVQSDDAAATRSSYEAMTDVVDGDDRMSEAERGHANLTRTGVRGGRTAIKGTVSAIGAVTNPASTASDLAEAAKDLAESVMDSSDDGYLEEEYGY